MLNSGKRIWIVVGDGAKARFLPYEGRNRGGPIHPIRTFAHHAAASRDLLADKPGRSFDRKGHNRHAISPRIDAHDQVEQRFLGEVIEQLAQDLEHGQFDECIIIFPPRALGYLRQHMPLPLKEHVSLELCQDLTKHPDSEIILAVHKSLQP